jgi:hypothetical protein
MDKIAPYYKAVAGALIPFLTAISVSLQDGTLTGQDWVQALIALIVGGGVVFAVPNIPNKPQSTTTTRKPPAKKPTLT